jgi:N utilization substance protein A
VREVHVDDDGRQATVIVPDDQLSLAIGREGQNARLAARLTGWRIDIKSETEFAEEEHDEEYQEEESSGRCGAVLSNGRRCPNASLPASHYCGLDSHQALRRFTTNSVTVLVGLTPDDLTALADGQRSDDDVAAIVARAATPAPVPSVVEDAEEGEAEREEVGLEPAPEAAAPEDEPDPEPEAAAPEDEPDPEPEAAAPEDEPDPEPEAAAPEDEPDPEPEAAAPEGEPDPEPPEGRTS